MASDEMMSKVRRMAMVRIRCTTERGDEWVEYSEPAIGIVLSYDPETKNGMLGIFAAQFFHDHQVLEILMEDATEVYNNMGLSETMDRLVSEVEQQIKELSGTTMDLHILHHYREEMKAQSVRFQRKAYAAMPEDVYNELIERRRQRRERMETLKAAEPVAE